MKALVTGGAGFVGSNLVKRLLKQNYRVLIVDNLITGSKKNLDSLPAGGDWEFVKSDIENFSTNYKFDEIYHLACPTGVPNCDTLGLEMLSACSQGTKNILKIALSSKSKLLFASSSEVYGAAKVYPQDENYAGYVNPIGFRSPYEEGKRFSETLIHYYFRKYKLNARITRIFNTYGPQMSKDDMRVIPRFINQALKSVSVTVEGTGKQKRTFCYIDDLVEGLILAIKKGKAGEVYNIGGNKQVEIASLAAKLIKLADSSSKISYIKRPNHDHDGRLPDLKKIKNLGWEPKVPLDKGLVLTIDYFKKELI